jgi:hypothetical protein
MLGGGHQKGVFMKAFLALSLTILLPVFVLANTAESALGNSKVLSASKKEQVLNAILAKCDSAAYGLTLVSEKLVGPELYELVLANTYYFDGMHPSRDTVIVGVTVGASTFVIESVGSEGLSCSGISGR